MRTDAVAEIATAARTTRAAGSARVHGRVFTDPPRAPERDVSFAYEGVTDVVHRRTRVVDQPIGPLIELPVVVDDTDLPAFAAVL